jgi:hypothetical protein
MTLAELNAAWQRMRTAVLGRSGLDEHVPPELASRFAQTLAGWDIWYRNAGPVSDVLGSADPEVASWLKRYRDLELDVRRAGRTLPVFTETPGEMLPDVGDVVAPLAVVAALAAGAWWFARKRGR